MIFRDRHEAGIKLAEKLKIYKNENPIILALPRGGVVVGFEVAKALKAPLDVVVVRKLAAPGNPEFGIGAIAQNGVTILDKGSIDRLRLSKEDIKEIKKEEQIELKRRVEKYGSQNSLKNLKGKTVILIDDGLATGVTARAAIKAVKKEKPEKIILANTVCAFEAAKELQKEVDEIICLAAPFDFRSVGRWYSDFPQVSDEEVVDLLQKARSFSR